MAHLLIKHKVKDYSTWKNVFDGFRDTRRSGGEKSYQILHPENEPNNILAIFEWDNLDNARKFTNNPKLKEAMGKAGVVEQPEFYFLQEHAGGKI